MSINIALDLMAAFNRSPIIGAVKDNSGLEQVLKSNCDIVFVLYGSAVDISDIVKRIKEASKYAIVHVDLIDGLAAREAAVDFVLRYSGADGIISTKAGLIKHAKAIGLVAIQRFFMLDSLSLNNALKQLNKQEADAVEILPGVMPKIIKRLCENTKKPIIAGGLIFDKEDITSALASGAVAVSTTNVELWNY